MNDLEGRLSAAEGANRALRRSLVATMEHLSAALTLDAVAAAVLDGCRAAFAADFAALLVDSGEGEEWTMRSAGLREAGGSTVADLLRDGSAACEALATGEPVWLVGPQVASRHPGGQFPLGPAVRALAVMPLALAGHVRGVLMLGSATERVLAQEERLAALALAHHCALAMDRARLYERERHIAQTLQHALLPPRLPRIPGLDIAVRFRPAGEGYEIGGDFFDVFERGGGEWCGVIGDVCGKGPEAAVLTALSRYTIRADAPHVQGPAEHLERLNRSVLN